MPRDTNKDSMMSPKNEDVQETPMPESITVREVWRDVRDLNKDVRRLLLILLGDGDERKGLVPQFNSLEQRTSFLEKIIYGGITVVLLAVLAALMAVLVNNPPQVSEGKPTTQTQLTGR